MKKTSIVTLFIAAVLIFSLTACSGKAENKSSSDLSYGDSLSPGTAGSANTSSQKDKGEAAAPQETYDEERGIANASTVTSTLPDSAVMEKIIRRMNMELETQDFDNLIEAINDEIIRLGGYVESSSISGKRYYYSNALRSGHIVARVPKEHLDEFVGSVSEVSNVVNKNENTENVTLQYVDAESHIKTLKIEQEKLYELLGKTGTLEDILTLESRLSSIRYELERYESQLRVYDNQVEYSTVTLNIAEVERMTPKEEENETVFTRIRTGFSDTMYSISEGFKDFFVGFVVNLPYILFWIVVFLGCFLLIRRSYRKYMRKDSPKQNNNGSEAFHNNESKDDRQ